MNFVAFHQFDELLDIRKIAECIAAGGPSLHISPGNCIRWSTDRLRISRKR
jgi:hypothetical protein